MGRTPAGAAKAGVCQQRQAVPAHARGAVEREPERYIAQVWVSCCPGKAVLGKQGLHQMGRVSRHGQKASDRRLLGDTNEPSERPGKGSSQSS